MNPNDPRYGQSPGPAQQYQPGAQAYPAAPQPGQPYFGTPVQQPTPAPYNPGGNTPYDFIFDGQPQPKKPLFGKGNAKQLLMLVGGIGTLLVVVIFIVMQVMGGSEPMQNVTAIAQQQQELIRVAAQGEHLARAETTKNLAYNVDLSISTSQSQILAYLSKHKVKLKDKELALKKDAATDQLLTNARATSTFDSTFQKVLADQLDTYLNDLQKEYKATKSASLKQILSTCFDAAKTLSNQARSTDGTASTP
ncbi:DUF3824 domain-containing protein [Candidatus Saccharibacteria bacterium]|nr:DUF3824 domain-containing protein [Candidatus Saccharibacteria bacterium]